MYWQKLGDIMSKGCDCFDWVGLLMATKELEGLNDVYREIANEIGIENTLAVYQLFHGTQVSFPNHFFSTQHIHSLIISEYDGRNVSQLAQKYNYSERTVWRILREKKEEDF